MRSGYATTATDHRRPLRVLQLHTRYRERGGEDTVVSTEAGLLRAGGHHVDQAVFENPGSRLRSATTLAVAPYNPTAVAVVADLVEPGAFDVVHVHNTWFTLSPGVLNALSRSDAAVVMTLHNYRLACAKATLFRDGAQCHDCLSGSSWPGVRHKCYRDSVSASAIAAGTIALHRKLDTWATSVDRFIAPSTCVRDRMVESGLVPAERVTVKPHVIRPVAGAQMAKPSESRRLLYVGRISEEKGITYLLDAWTQSRVDDLELVIVGDGPLLPVLEKAPPPDVTFLGQRPRDHVARLMGSSRALLFPSVTEETFGNVVVEAMSHGLPVFASNAGGPVDILADGGGELIGAGNVEEWAKAIASLRTRDDLDGLGRRAVTIFRRSYSSDNGLAPLEDVYREAMAARANSSPVRAGETVFSGAT